MDRQMGEIEAISPPDLIGFSADEGKTIDIFHLCFGRHLNIDVVFGNCVHISGYGL
jgi:hypothetical protein